MAAFREKLIKSKLYRVVLWVILFSMGGGTLLFSLFFKQPGSGRPVMLEVNGEEITYKQYEQRLAQEYENLAMLRQRYGEYAEAFLKLLGLDNPQELALKNLINEELMNQVADNLNLQLSSQFVMQKLYDPAFVVQELRDVVPIQVLDPSGLINMGALKYWLQRHGQTMGDFEKNLEQALKRKIVTDLIGSTVFISPEEAKQYFSSNFLKKKYEILVFPFEKYLKEVKKKPLDQKEMATFFKAENEVSKRYWVPEKRSGALWKFTSQDYGISISDQEIEHYYSKHKQDKFLEAPVQIQLRRILFKIKEGSPATTIKEKAQKVKDKLEANPDQFEKLAQQHSDDKKSAEKGGDLGLIKRGDRDAAFWRAALRLQKDGATSDLVATEEGIEILQRVARKLATYKPLESVKKDILQTLLRQKFKQRFADDAERTIKDKKAIDDFITSKKGKKETITEQVLDESVMSQKLFKTRKGAWSYLFDKDGNGILVNVSQIEKSHEPSLDTVTKEVEKDLYGQKAQKALDNALKDAESKAKQQDLRSLAENMGLEIKSTDWIKRDDTEKLEKLDKEGMPVQRLLFRSDRIGSLAVAHSKDNGYLAKLDTVEPFDWVIYKDKKQEIIKSLSQEKKDLLTKAFIDSFYKNAKIKRMEEPRAPQQVPLDDIF